MNNLDNGLYCMYLRKSREDIEAEQHGEGDTLLRHENRLMDTAKKLNLNIGKIYREIVSGESIDARPEVQKLISEVERGIWKGCLVVEVERLARGDTLDQGIIARAFSISGTKIITPLKIYDPLNDSDMEYFEFGLFMSRREYATINRRIQSGRIASVKEGKWIYKDCPYGYRRIKLQNDKGYTMEFEPSEKPAIDLIFHMYCHEHIGSYRIACRLDELGYKSRKGITFSPSSVRDILSNPVYAGYVKWGERAQVKEIVDGHIVKRRKNNPDALIVKGLHPPIITDDEFQLAQEVRKKHAICSNNNIQSPNGLQNPLAGLVYCSKCGKTMRKQRDNKKHINYRLVCNTVRCGNVSSNFDAVETAVIDALDVWTKEYEINYNNGYKKVDTFEEDLRRLQEDKAALENQKGKIFDYFERGVYDETTFISRNRTLADRISTAQDHINELIANHEEEARGISSDEFIKKVKSVREAYDSCSTNEQKNRLLKSVFKRIEYEKTEGGPGKETAFSLEIYPIVDFL